MKKLLYISILCCFFSNLSWAQTADIQEGCVPLTVNFTAPASTGYFWEFGDLASSNLQNPEHIFTNPGSFKVMLFDAPGGTKIGEIEVKVYADPIITINSDPPGGCSPLLVNFTSQIDIDPAISILSYKWTFGDGTSSTQQNPSHNYTNSGVYTVSVAIETSIAECNKTVIFTDEITVEGVSSTFTLNKLSDCTIPATFTITNTSENSSDYTYIWDYGDGTDKMGYDGGSITYNESGKYTIGLTVINEAGCESLYEYTVTVGPPIFNLSLPNAVCIDEQFMINNNTVASSFSWSFGPGAIPQNSTMKEPTVQYNSGGPKIISFKASNSATCFSDTTFMIDVQDPTAEFTYDPNPTCISPATINFSAVNSTYANYDWSMTTENDPNIQFEYVLPKRDSLHLHWRDSLFVELIVTTDIGCTASFIDTVVQRKPDAYYVVDRVDGCAPLLVSFSDSTRSVEDVISWTWLYGDGTQETITNGDNPSHIYTNPGEYYSQLIIENDLGCKDTSAGLWIRVGEQIESTYMIDNTEICLGESINISMDNLDPRIDAWQINTDDNRFDHCWKDNSATHQFVHAPGTYDISITTEYNGCYWNQSFQDVIEVKGAKANLSWMTNCEDPYTVMLTSNSLGQTSLSWDVEMVDQFQDEMFNYTFSETGDYKIYLTAFDNTSSCPIGIDSATIYIRDIKADFELPEQVCDNEQYSLFAGNSIDVYESCSKGYLWNYQDSRPRELGSADVEVTFSQPGLQEVTLIVEDINGCTDTLTKSTTSYGNNPDFEMDRSLVCLPAEINFNDLSTGDTTIVAYEWDFGGDKSEETYVFTTADNNPQIPVTLTVTDEVGCMDSLVQYIDVYEIESTISYDNGPGICIGEEITFTASDYTETGSFLHFDWDFGPFGTSMNQSETVLFNQSGNFQVNLNFTEDTSGCQGNEMVDITVVKVPEAGFSTSVDNEEVICHPAIIDFTNESDWEGPVVHSWKFGNGVKSFEVNPSNSFPKGTFEVQLVVSSVYGCRDTVTQSYTLVGPEGDFELDKSDICKGETIQFNLKDTADVHSFTWVFGDGTIEENVDPISHQFDFYPPGGETKVDLILKSVDTGCEFIVTEPITMTEVLADFDVIDSSYCEGLAIFENLSSGNVTNFEWNFGDGNAAVEFSPIHLYNNLGMYEVTLRASDAQGKCFDEITKEVNIEEVEDFIFFPNVFSPNGDGVNDFFNVEIKPGYEDVINILTFKVYNRWGELLYDNTNPTLGWDALYKGADSPATIYAYYIEVEIIDCKNEAQKGNVTIVR